MKASVLTLRQIRFLRLRLDPDENFRGTAEDFDFAGVPVKCQIKLAPVQSVEVEGWWVIVSFGCKPKSDKPVPYKLDVGAAGLFTVSPAIPPENQERLVYENGAALVFGAIREMVATVTGRFHRGSLVLPTLTFMNTYQAGRTSTGPTDPAPTGAG